MEAPLVSIIIPVWGPHRRYLDRCLAALASQLPAEQMQILVIDNQCDQPVPADLADRVIRLPERVGVGAARNAGLAQADGMFIVFADADDVLLPGTLRFLLDRFAERPELLLCAVSGVRVDHDGAVVSNRRNRPHLRRDRRLAIEGLFNFCCAMVNGTMIRREAVLRAGGFAGTVIAEDSCLSSRLLFYGPCELHPQVGWHALAHDQSLWYGNKHHYSSDYLLALDREKFDRVAADPNVPRWVIWLVLPLARRFAAHRVRKQHAKH